MTDFKFAKECSKRGIEFDGCKEYFRESIYCDSITKNKIKTEIDTIEKIYILHDYPCSVYVNIGKEIKTDSLYPNPSEEELSKRLPNVIEYMGGKFKKIAYINKVDYQMFDYKKEKTHPNKNLCKWLLGGKIGGETTKECKQKALLKLNDMELLRNQKPGGPL